MQVEGRNKDVMDVTEEGQAITIALSKEYAVHESEDHKHLFSFHSSWTTDGANQEVFYFENEETTLDFFVDEIILGVVATDRVTLIRRTSGTAAGTDITAVNQHLGDGQVYSYTCKGDAEVTGSVAGAIIRAYRLLANTTIEIPIKGRIIIGKNEAIAVTVESSGTEFDVTLIGYFDSHD